jgi:hypothetical protein
METVVECTHCKVVMTSWSAPGSTIRYFQCPFCTRTHSSLYGEVFRRRAGARVLEGAPRPAAAAADIPMASPEDVRWARVKATASRWFARLEAEQRRCEVAAPPARVLHRTPVRSSPVHAGRTAAIRAAAVRAENVPEVDPSEVIELASAHSPRKP